MQVQSSGITVIAASLL